MSQYTTTDFSESIKELDLDGIVRVVAAWGNVDTDGQCCAECGGEWSGGFLLELKDGRYAYASGWCDYTGWGCQDGISTEYFDKQPALESLKSPIAAWDLEPADLNKWLNTPEAEL